MHELSVATLLDWVRQGHRRLEDELGRLPPDALAQNSILPGWTRGHVVTHLARNADALRNLLYWARTGERTPMYPSYEARNSAIEMGAGRPLPEQLEDLQGASARFVEAAEPLAGNRSRRRRAARAARPVPLALTSKALDGNCESATITRCVRLEHERGHP